jgi:hypothetical protein
MRRLIDFFRVRTSRIANTRAGILSPDFAAFTNPTPRSRH